MARARRLAAPRIDPVVLPDLDDASADDLRGGVELTARRIEGGDRSGADLAGLGIDACLLEGIVLDEAALTSARIIESRLARITASALHAKRSTFRSVEIADSRFGAAEFWDAALREVEIRGCRIGYLDLAGSTVADLRIADCTIDELNVADATLTRVALPGCRIGVLHVQDARLTDVDLRDAQIGDVSNPRFLAGATIDDALLFQIAPTLATDMGIRLA